MRRRSSIRWSRCWRRICASTTTRRGLVQREIGTRSQVAKKTAPAMGRLCRRCDNNQSGRRRANGSARSPDPPNKGNGGSAAEAEADPDPGREGVGRAGAEAGGAGGGEAGQGRKACTGRGAEVAGAGSPGAENRGKTRARGLRKSGSAATASKNWSGRGTQQRLREEPFPKEISPALGKEGPQAAPEWDTGTTSLEFFNTNLHGRTFRFRRGRIFPASRPDAAFSLLIKRDFVLAWGCGHTCDPSRTDLIWG